MNEELMTLEQLKTQFPDEWILLGNPVMDDKKIDVLSCIPIFHSKDKKEVCYIGRDKAIDFETVTLVYTGYFKPIRKITGIFRRNEILY